MQLIITPLLMKYLKQSNAFGFLVAELHINTSSNLGMLDILMQPEVELQNSKPVVGFGLS